MGRGAVERNADGTRSSHSSLLESIVKVKVRVRVDDHALGLQEEREHERKAQPQHRRIQAQAVEEKPLTMSPLGSARFLEHSCAEMKTSPLSQDIRRGARTSNSEDRGLFYHT